MNTSVLIGIPCLMTGGTEIQTLRLVEALSAGGYHCVTVCYFEYDYTMVQKFEKAGSRVVCLSAYGRRPEGNRKVYKFLKEGLRRVVKEYRPKIAHVQYMAPGAMPIVILNRLGVKNIIATLHTDADIYKSLRLIHFLQRHRTIAFTCVTEKAERSFFGTSSLYDKDLALKRHNHFTIHNCLPPNIYNTNDHQSNGPAPQKTGITIGLVARLESIKGADLALPAFAKVLRTNPDCRLKIVGDGTLRKMMEQQQHELGINQDSIEWTGRIEYHKLPELYSSIDLVWVPSRSEGFGLSAIEAMACGCAVVASATGGLTEIINDGTDGLLFTSGNTDDLTDKTVRLLSNPEQLNQLRINAQVTAHHYTFERYRDNILNLYSKLN